jgi:hypothetical protein
MVFGNRNSVQQGEGGLGGGQRGDIERGDVERVDVERIRVRYCGLESKYRDIF